MAVVSSGPLSLQTKALVAKCLRCEVSVWACEEQALNADHDIARQSAKNPTRNKLVNRIVALRILRSWHELLRFRLKTCNPVKLERRKLSKVSKSERWEFLVERQKHTLTETSKKCNVKTPQKPCAHILTCSRKNAGINWVPDWLCFRPDLHKSLLPADCVCVCDMGSYKRNTHWLDCHIVD